MSKQSLYDLDCSRLLEYEYDAQLFEFTIFDFIIAILLLVEEEVTGFTEAMKASLIKKYTPDDPEIELVKEATKKLIDMYMCATKKHLRVLEVQMKQVFHIPSHVLLPSDAVQRTQHSPEDEKEADEQFDNLLKRLLVAKLVEVELQQELKFLQETLPIVSKQIKQYECVAKEQDESTDVFKQVKLDVIDEIINNKQFS